MMPSSPCAGGRLEKADPSPTTWAANRTLRSVLDDRPKQPLALLERDVEQRPAVVVEQVEGLVDERRVRGVHVVGSSVGRATLGSPAAAAVHAGDPATGRLRDPGLEQREVRPAVVSERDDLAVDDRLLGASIQRAAA